jgi:hypothetical protein
MRFNSKRFVLTQMQASRNVLVNEVDLKNLLTDGEILIVLFPRSRTSMRAQD